MGWRFRRTLKILPGVRLNFSRRGVSASIGVRGAHITLGGPTGPRVTVGLPGSGLSYTKVWPKKGQGRKAGEGTKRAKDEGQERQVVAGLPEAALELRPPGLVEGLFMSEAERLFDTGVYHLWNDRSEEAAQCFADLLAKEPDSGEGHFLAALAERVLGNVQAAIEHLEKALDSDDPLPGPWIQRHAAGLTYDLPITATYTASLELDEIAAALTLAELYQAQGRLREAITILEIAAEAMPDEPLLRLSLGELYVTVGEDDKAIHLLAPIAATDDLTLACRVYYAQALWHKGLFDAALEVAEEELRRTAGRDPELLQDMRYIRALALEGKGQLAQARREWQRLYAQDPNYRDVAKRIGAWDRLSHTK